LGGPADTLEAKDNPACGHDAAGPDFGNRTTRSGALA